MYTATTDCAFGRNRVMACSVRYFVLVVFFVFSVQAKGQELSVFASEYPPYVKVANGQLSGYSIDVFAEVQRRLGWSYQVRLIPWARAFSEVTTQPDVLLLFMSRTAPRDKMVRWSRPYSHDTLHLYALKSRADIAIKSPEDIADYSIVSYRSGAPTTFLKEMGVTSEQLIEVNAPMQLVEMLKRGRVDLAADFDKGFVYNSLHYNSDKVTSQPLTQLLNQQVSVGFALSKSANPVVLRQIDDAIVEMEKDGTLEQLRVRWFDYMLLEDR